MTISPLSNSPLQSLFGSSRGSGKVNSTTQAILDVLARTSGEVSGTTSGNGVSISTGAKAAAAALVDNKKDFGELTSDVRAALTGGDVDLGELSGRALSAIVLNRSKTFTGAEIAAAKLELSGRTRDDFTAIAGNGNGLSGLAAYNQQLVSQYDSMSFEEREARGWTSAVRSSAAAFVSTSEGTISSLFAMLDQNG